MTARKDLPAVEDMARNVCDTFDHASADEIAAGMDWYAQARRHAEGFAARYGISREIATAVIAVLSPQTEWTVNLAIADRACALYAEFGTAEGCGTTAQRWSRADIALSGDLSDVARRHRTRKVHAFNLAILGDAESVTVDRHAVRVAIGDLDNDIVQGPSTDAAYNALEHAYKLAADSLGITPRELQAIVWVHCVNYRTALTQERPAVAV